jgi:hypothetical protein
MLCPATRILHRHEQAEATIMTRAFHPAVCFTLFCGLLTSIRPCGADERLVGDWVGGFEDNKDYMFVQLHLKTEDGNVSGTYDAPLLFQQGRSLERLVIKPPTVSFEIPNNPDTRLFAGEIKMAS